MAARVCDFVWMNPPKFLGAQFCKEQNKFIDEVKYILCVITVTRSYR